MPCARPGARSAPRPSLLVHGGRGPTRNMRGRTSAPRHLIRAVVDTFGTARMHCDHPSRVALAAGELP
eukprot:3084144-Prymnesium_polylepis.2